MSRGRKKIYELTEVLSILRKLRDPITVYEFSEMLGLGETITRRKLKTLVALELVEMKEKYVRGPYTWHSYRAIETDDWRR